MPLRGYFFSASGFTDSATASVQVMSTRSPTFTFFKLAGSRAFTVWESPPGPMMVAVAGRCLR